MAHIEMRIYEPLKQFAFVWVPVGFGSGKRPWVTDLEFGNCSRGFPKHPPVQAPPVIRFESYHLNYPQIGSERRNIYTQLT